MSQATRSKPSASRRAILTMGAASLLAASIRPARAQAVAAPDEPMVPFANGTLPNGLRSRIIRGVNGLDVHVLEAGEANAGRPLALLLHGFPDLAYGWRHVMPLLAEAGYYVVAPDQRGYGRTTGWVNDYDAPLAPFSVLNMTRDAMALVAALGYRRTTMLVGHDLGSPVAAYCALARPDVFPSVVLMSAPFPGTPALPFNTANSKVPAVQPHTAQQALVAALAALSPARQHYQQYLSMRAANEDMWHPAGGLQAFLRTFFYVKSGDWPGNQPRPLKGATAAELAQMPSYYIMERGKTLPQNVAPFQPAAPAVWLTEQELGVYAGEYGRTGFQGALQAYRVHADAALNAELRLFSGKTIDVPSLFIGGSRDWATYVAPGAVDLMKTKAMTKLRGIELIEDAGHWIQQEQPARLCKLLLAFMKQNGEGANGSGRSMPAPSYYPAI